MLLANLIDRLPDPAACLAALPDLVAPGGMLLITSPYTWLPEFTAPAHWLGGYTTAAGPVRTLDALDAALSPSFTRLATEDMPFLIREHVRKFQWSVAQATLWQRSPANPTGGAGGISRPD